MERKRHDLVCQGCYVFIAELQPEEIGPGHHKIAEFDRNIEYIGSELCDECLFCLDDEDD